MHNDHQEGNTSWDEDKSTKAKAPGPRTAEVKADKGKGRDFRQNIQGMDFEQARAWFRDYEVLDKKSGKA